MKETLEHTAMEGNSFETMTSNAELTSVVKAHHLRATYKCVRQHSEKKNAGTFPVKDDSLRRELWL